MRCFVGIPLSEAVRSALADVSTSVRATDSNWRGEKWVAPANLHITVAFFGEVAIDSVGTLTDALGTAFDGLRAFELPFAGIRPVPNEHRARMLWAVYGDPTGECAKVAVAANEAAGALGIAVEDRAFRAHVTLARARRPHPIDPAALDALELASTAIPRFVSVRSATLFSSTLAKAGPRYDALRTWEFPA